MKINLSLIFKFLVGAAIGGALIYFLTSSMDVNKVWNYIVNSDKQFFIYAITFSFISHISRGLRWSILLEDQGYQTSKLGLISGTFFGYFINIIFPRAGEVARCSSVSYKYNLPGDKLLGTIVLERVIDLMMLISCIFLVLFLDLDLFGSFFQDRLSELETSLANMKIILISLPIVGATGVYLVFKLRDKIGFFDKIHRFIKGIFEGLISLRKLKRKGLFIFHTLFIWFNYILMSYVPFYAFETTKSYDWIQGMFVFILGGIGMTIPSPGGTGSYHYAVTMGMTEVLKTPKEIAEAYAFSVHGIITLFTLIMGIIVSIYLFKGKIFDYSKQN